MFVIFINTMSYTCIPPQYIDTFPHMHNIHTHTHTHTHTNTHICLYVAYTYIYIMQTHTYKHIHYTREHTYTYKYIICRHSLFNLVLMTSSIAVSLLLQSSVPLQQ